MRLSAWQSAYRRIGRHGTAQGAARVKSQGTRRKGNKPGDRADRVPISIDPTLQPVRPSARVDIDAEVTRFPMRQGPNNRRPRGRNSGGNRRPNVPNRNQTFDSNGPDVRIRGNAYQVYEKYLALARDAAAAGDRVMGENYLQHAEHYHRIILSMTDPHHHAHPSQPQPGEMRDAPARGEAAREASGEDQDGETAGRDGRRPQRDNRPMRPARDGRDNGNRSYGRGGDGFAEPAPARADDLRGGDNGASRPADDPRDGGQPFVDFGSDPRTADARDGGEEGNGRSHPQAFDETATADRLAEAEDGGEAVAEAGDDGEDAAPRAPRRRRGLGRQRRSASGASAGDLGDGAGDDEQADLGI